MYLVQKRQLKEQPKQPFSFIGPLTLFDVNYFPVKQDVVKLFYIYLYYY